MPYVRQACAARGSVSDLFPFLNQHKANIFTVAITSPVPAPSSSAMPAVNRRPRAAATGLWADVRAMGLGLAQAGSRVATETLARLLAVITSTTACVPLKEMLPG